MKNSNTLMTLNSNRYKSAYKKHRNGDFLKFKLASYLLIRIRLYGEITIAQADFFENIASSLIVSGNEILGEGVYSLIVDALKRKIQVFDK